MSGYKVERWNAFHPPNSAMLRYTLNCEGFDVFQWAERPGTGYGLKKLGEDKSHWIVSGQMEIFVEKACTFQLGPGDRDFIPAGTYHSARVIGEESVLYFIGIKQPAPVATSAPKKPKRTRSSKRKPAVKKAEPAKSTKKPATKKTKRKPTTTNRKPAAKKARSTKAIKKKSKT